MIKIGAEKTEQEIAQALKAAAADQVNAWAEAKIIQSGILVRQNFYGAMIANVAFSLLTWNAEGRPAEPDTDRFITTYSEAQAYRDAHAGAGTPEENLTVQHLLQVQEGRWLQMQTGFAAILYARRYALEKIKLAATDETLPAALEAIMTGLMQG